MKAKGDILMDATNIKTNATAINEMAAGAQVLTKAPITYFDSAITAGTLVVADVATAATSLGGVVPPKPAPVPFDKENTADNKDNEESESTTSSPKVGFIFADSGMVVYKPKSDTKPGAVSLSLDPSPHELYQAIPTGELETVTVQYRNEDRSLTEWEVVRPIHEPGKLIERGKFHGIANGGRAHWTWSKEGSEYPAQMFLKIGSEYLFIIMADIRHQSLDV